MSTPTFLGPLIGKGVGQCELVNAERGSVLASQVEPAFDSTTRKKGLLGRDSIPDDYALIIAPCSAVHTFGMRTPLDLVFVAKNGTITKTCRGVQPWRMAGSMRAHAVVEAAPGFIDRHEIVPGETVALRETANSGRPAEATPLLGLTPVAEPRATPARLTTRKRVTLADIIARKTPLAWFEAVAIVQELCETVLERGPADDLRVPELKHITLTAEGNVTLLSEGPSGHSPVQRAGLVLLALTPEEQLPMQLRLLTLEEVSPRPRLSSLKDLHRELEFFERPDRQSIVREVYERFQLQSSPAAVESAVPAPLLEPPPPKRHHRWWKGRSVWVGSVIVLLSLAAAALVWAWPRPEGQWLRTNASQLTQASLDAGRKAVQAVRNEMKSAKWQLGSRPRGPEPSVLVLADSGPSGPPARQDITLEGGVPAPAVPPFELPKTPLSGAPEPVPARPVPGVETPGPAVEPGTIFSAANSGVVPPRLIRPSSTRAPQPGTAVAALPEVELLVSASGEVESVKLVSPGQATQPGMQLSAIKAWRYEPATLGGQPVRYRLRVRLPLQ